MTIPEITQILRAAQVRRITMLALARYIAILKKSHQNMLIKNVEEFDRYEQIFCVR